jgi:hypothetical protein
MAKRSKIIKNQQRAVVVERYRERRGRPEAGDPQFSQYGGRA